MNVLYVSGDADARGRIAAGLGDRDGIEAVTTDTVAAARDRLDGTRFDAAVIDHDPPVTDAPDTVAALAETAPSLPLVVFTDSGSEAVASESFAAGAAGYLRDDGSLDTLAARVRALAGQTGTGAVSTKEGAVNTKDETVDATDVAPADADGRARMFSTLVSNLPGIAYRCHNEPGWPMEFVSEGASDLVGYAPERIEADEISWGEDVIHPADRERVFETVQDAVAANEPFTLSYRIRTADDEQKWVWEQGRAVADDTGDDRVLEGFITDITEQREYQRRLEAVFDGTFQFMGLLDPDGTIIEANEAALSFGGLDRADVVGEYVWDTYWWQTGEADTDRLRDAVERAASGEFVRYDERVQGVEEVRTIDFSIRPITDDEGRVTLLVPEGRDITELKRRKAQLEALNDLAERLTAASDASAICEAVVTAARETLDLELAAVERYDEDAGTLVPCARTDAVTDLVGDDRLFAADRGEDWQTFVDAEGMIFEGISARSDVSATGTPLDSAIVLPLGRHGVFIAGSADSVSFDDPEIDLARTLATHAETAFDRLERERSLRQRTETLKRRTERLDRADRLARTVRAVANELREAPTRDAIERGVCQRLADTLPVSLVWIGREDPVSGELGVEASAGVEDGYLDSVALSVTPETDDPEPSVRAARTGSPQSIDEIRTDPPMAHWREEALVRPFQSVCAVPITHADTRYGVVTLYGTDAAQFTEWDRSVLADLGALIGFVITATQRKRSLSADGVVELEFQATDPSRGLLAMLADLGGSVAFHGLVPRPDRSIRVFLTRPTDDRDAVTAAAAAAPGVSDVAQLSIDDRARYEVTTTGEGLLATLVEHGVRLRTLSVEGSSVRFGVELPDNRDVREFAETVERGPDGATLVARRERDAPRRTASGFRNHVRSTLSDRQLEALKTAYLSGFFESPRTKTGEEIAALLDVSQPTFNRHLRAAQASVFESLFEE